MQFEDRVMKMDVIRKDTVCRLCLKAPLTEFVVIGETTKEILDVLLVKMDLATSTEPLMCKDCTEMVKKSLSFKSVCVDTEERLVEEVLFKADGDNAKVCRFCMKTNREGQFVPLDVLIKRDTFSDMIKQYMFHMDLNLTMNPQICLNCRDNMESYFKFLQNCRDTEEKINAYQRNNGVNGQSIMLVNVSKTYSICPKKDLCDSMVDIEEDMELETVPSDISSNQELKIETKELIIKDEVTISEETSQRKQLGGRSKAHFERDKSKPGTKHKRHLLTHKNVSDAQMYQCDCCKFQTKYKQSLKAHLVTHKDPSEVRMYQCDSCEFKTKHRHSFTTHLLLHKDPSEIRMYECDSCGYKTKHKGHLKKHELIHKDFSDVQAYQCDICEYRTKVKETLKRHMLVHKDSSEVQMYRCEFCEYETNRKDSLKSHMLAHKDSPEVEIYQCYNCEYQSKRKDFLDRHMLIHNDSSDTKLYRCYSCKYQTKCKDYLKKHMVVHKDPSQVRKYQCDNCKYQTKCKRSFEVHMWKHKDSSEVQLYQCDFCDLKTKRKDCLKRHIIMIHRDPSEIQIYSCDRCAFMTKYKRNFKVHLLTHK